MYYYIQSRGKTKTKSKSNAMVKHQRIEIFVSYKPHHMEKGSNSNIALLYYTSQSQPILITRPHSALAVVINDIM